MKCYYCKNRLHPSSVTDICEMCLFHLDDVEQEYDDRVQEDIETVINKGGVTPARYID